MSVQKTIDRARKHLECGNAYAYAAIISAGIRCSMSKASINKYRRAVEQDDMVNAFTHWDTVIPVAKEGFI